MATYRKRSAGWRAEVFRMGVRDSQTFATKAQAVAWATQREADILAGKGRAGSGDFTVLQALEKYRVEVSVGKPGRRWEEIRIDRFARELDFVGERIAEIEADQLARWRDARLKQVSAPTVTREMNLLSSIFEQAKREWRWCRHNPVREIRRPGNNRPRDRRISAAEEQALLDALGYVDGRAPQTQMQEVAYAFLIALETAMRKGEILTLKRDALHLPQRYVRLLTTKNGDARNVPLSQRAVQLLHVLEGVAVTQGRDSLFVVNLANADVLFRRVRNGLGIENLHFHDTRHEATTRLARKLDVLDLARMTGHRDPRSLMVYYNATASEVASRLD